jgi:hypothetical protein
MKPISHISRVLLLIVYVVIFITCILTPVSHQTYFDAGDGYKFSEQASEYINNNRDELIEQIRKQRGKIVAYHHSDSGDSGPVTISTNSETLPSENPFVQKSKETTVTRRSKWTVNQKLTVDVSSNIDKYGIKQSNDGIEEVDLDPVEINSPRDIDLEVGDLDTMDVLKYLDNLHKWNNTHINIDASLTWVVELEHKLNRQNETTSSTLEKADVDFRRMLAVLETTKNETMRLQQEVLTHKLQLEHTRNEKQYLEKLQRLKDSYDLYIAHHNTTTVLWEQYLEEKKDATQKIDAINQKLAIIQELKTHIFNIKQRHKQLSIWFNKWKKIVEETDFTIIIPGENATDTNVTINHNTYSTNNQTVTKIYHEYVDTDPNPLRDGNCFCAVVYEPVCGDDGHTYSSECVAKCGQVKVMYKRPCECKEEQTTTSSSGGNVLFVV